MKKLLLFAGVAAAIAAAPAATATWGTSAFYVPTEDGTYSETTLVGKGNAWGYLWEVDKATYDKFANNLSSIYTEFAKSTTHGALGTETTKGSSTTASKIALEGTTVWGSDSGSKGTTAYGILLYTYNDGENDWYVANAAKYDDIATMDVAVSKLNLYVGGSIDSVAKGVEITGWQSVPEPFSGTLVLVGMAGLALRRKLKKQKKA